MAPSVRTAEASTELSLDTLVALARRVQAACVEAGLTVATAESITGGLIGHAVTEVPGSSRYFRGGVVSYEDAVKAAQLGVPTETLAHHGAVSAQTALAMATGVRTVLGADLGVAVTGIAGPDGGSREKPVGLTYIAVADRTGSVVERHAWDGDRHANKLASAEAALLLVLKRIGEGSGT